MQKVLVVDDIAINRDILVAILEEVYEPIMAADGVEALDCVSQYGTEICAILLDLMMPKMNGFEVLEELKKRGILEHIPVLVISGDHSTISERTCFDAGVSDFIPKPFTPGVVLRRVQNVVKLYNYQTQLEKTIDNQIVQLTEQNRVLEEQARKLKENNVRIIDILGNIVESRNLESGEHVKRVKGFTKILAKQLKADDPTLSIEDEWIDMVTEAAALHDIGKISIPDHILLKPGRLTEEEFEEMKLHTTRGSEIVLQMKELWENEYKQICYDIARFHHERYDGRGYPDHLVGDQIPLCAQIVSICDVYDALVSERCYKRAFSKEEAFDMIMNGECGTFAPYIYASFERAKSAFEMLVEEIRNHASC